ncbi:hypothetical protein Tco_0458393 [Tanacetum coccineum]
MLVQNEVIDIDVQTAEAADLMVVSSTSLTGATRKAAEMDGSCLEALDITSGNIEAISPSADHEEEASYDDDGIITDFNNLPDEVDVSTNHTLRIHNAHPQSQILGDPNTPVQTRSSSHEDHEANALKSKKTFDVESSRFERLCRKNVAVQLSTMLVAQGHRKEEGIDYDEVFAPVARLEAIRSPKGKCIDVWTLLGFVKSAVTPKETNKGPLASRPDIMYAVCACSRFQVTPKVSHLYAVKRIFKYIKGKPKLGLWYPRESPLDLVAYSDSDYAAANLDRKSTTGGCQFLGRRLISWQCKKQTIVATSTTEAEYVAAASCCGQVLWLQNQLLDYGFNFMNTIIHIDNQSTICIIKNPVYHSKTKHIEIRHHFIRDCYEKKLIQVQKIHTDLNVADLLTKPFDGPRYYFGKDDAGSTWTWKRTCQLSLANWMQIGLGFLLKPAESAGYTEIVDFLRRSKLRYALTHNPPIYDSLVKQFWQTATARTLADGTQQLNATIDSIEYTITEESVRRQLQLADASGINMLQNEEIFAGLQNIGYVNDRTFTFWKSHFTPQWRFLIHHILHCISSKSGGWDQFGSNIATALICQPQPSAAPTPSQPVPTPTPSHVQITPPPISQPPPTLTQPVQSTTPPPQSSSVQLTPTPPPIPTSTSPPPPPPPPETEPTTDEYIYEEQSPVHHHFSPLQEQAPSRMPMDDLLQAVPKLISRIDSLEMDLKQTKLTMGNAIVKLVKKVKKLEGFLKRRNLVLTDSEDEEPEAQGRKSQDDPQDSSIQGLVTPPTTKVHASGEEQVEDISPNTLEAAKNSTQRLLF